MNEEFDNIQSEENGAEELLNEDLTEEPQDDAQSIEDVLTDNEQTEKKKPQSAGGQKEPGYVRNRINEAVAAATRQMQEELESLRSQMAPLREYQLNAEAQELVRSGKVKDLETAKELVRYRQGQPVTPVPVSEEQPRNEHGQFAPKQDPATSARVSMLEHQADKIKAQGGPDVITEFMNNEDTKQKVISGEWDFYDVAEYLNNQKSSRKKPPAPTRSANGVSGSERSSIATMSPEQWKKFDESLDGGSRYLVR